MGARVWVLIFLCLASVVKEFSCQIEGSPTSPGVFEDTTLIPTTRKPPALSHITLNATNHTAVMVTWEAPSNKEENDLTVAYIAGWEEKQCTTKDATQCTIDGLLPRILYKVCVRVCHAKTATATTVSPAMEGARLVSSSDLLAVATTGETEGYICSKAICGSVVLPMEAPSNITLNATNHTAVMVTWEAPSNKEENDLTVAYIAGWEEKQCTTKDATQCTIDGLLPRILYKVCVRVCHAKTATATTVSPAMEGARLVSSSDLLAVATTGETEGYICSKAICGSVVLPMEAPSNITLNATNHTAVMVTWEAPSNKEENDLTVAYIAGWEEKQCTTKDATQCTIDGLLPRILYKVCVRVCHAKTATATTVSPAMEGARLVSSSDLLAVATTGETEGYICSKAICGSVVLPMEAPSNITLNATNHTAVMVTWEAPSNKEENDLTVAYIAGWEEKQCTTKDATQCTIDGLLPRILYKVCVRVCHAKTATATTVSPAMEGARLVSSSDLLAVATTGETEGYICSKAICGSVVLPMEAPKNVTVTLLGPYAVNVSWQSPSDSDANDVYNAYTEGPDRKQCRREAGGLPCTFAGLLPSTGYEFCVQICHVLSSKSIYHSDRRRGSIYLSDDLSGSPSDSWNAVCGPSSCTSAITPSDNLLLMILLGIFIPLIIILLLVLFFVLCRHLCNRDSSADNAEPVPFPIEYCNPSGPKSISSGPSPIPIENFAANLQELDESNGFQSLFQSMGDLAALEVENRYCLTKVAASLNRNRNRYSDMVPYDQSLVLVGRPWSTVLTNPEPQLTNAEVMDGYINASYVRRPEYGSGGEALVASVASLPEYIATQGPLESTVADFLTMVCEQRCPLIIMLCQFTEGGKEKCAQYWPEDLTQTFKSENRSVEVWKESEEHFGEVTCRQLRIHPSSEASPWTVTHFQFMDWVDYGVPNMESFYNFVNFQNNFLANHPIGNEYGPTVMHCSAGVGRTGTFMAARFLLDRLRRSPQNVDIIGTVLAIRKWRRSLVQVELQLRFLYDFINFCLVKENFVGKSNLPPLNAPLRVASAVYTNAMTHPQLNALEPNEDPNVPAHPQSSAVYGNQGGNISKPDPPRTRNAQLPQPSTKDNG
ncbi:hypothetical protein TcWFU_000328 [Taenia crassiceps]|uniref:Protein-tyrosine-phosphatase n=1 Tax=Taenia crassiceps TaxID=6207 RepID=A0ABR4QAK8_9CEST